MKRLLLIVISFAAAAHAGAVDVVVRSNTPQVGSSGEATLTASSVMVGDGQGQRTVRLSVPGRVTVDLPPGVWRLQIKADGWFHAGDIVTIHESQTSIVVPVWQLGNIGGTFKTSGGEVLDRLTARWSAPAKEPSNVPDGEMDCVVGHAEYRCAIPAGIVDVKLRPKGYSSHFLWHMNVSAAKTTDVPLIRFKKGAGIYGWVRLGQGVKSDIARSTVRLVPVSIDGRARRPITATVSERGFFAFSGVDPGSYRIAAYGATNDIGSQEHEIVVRSGGETELLDGLTLERRAPLRVTMVPSVDPAGTAWQIALSHPVGGQDDDLPGQWSADLSGVAVIPNIPPGPYSISVRPKAGGAAALTQTIELPRDSDLTLKIPSTRVVGTVRMNDRPVAAAVIWIGGKYRSPGVTLTTDEEGAFSGVAPLNPDERWEITISRPAPTIERTIRQLPVREDEGTVRLDIDVPGGMIEGVVLESNGLPAAKGNVNVLPADGDGNLMQTRFGADGHFELAGLEPGHYTLYAEGSGGRTSDRSRVTLLKDGVSSVELQLGVGRHLAGRLTTVDGAAVAGARIHVNSVEVPPEVWIPRTTSGAGEFEFVLPDGTRSIDVLVTAPGFAFKAFRALLNTEQQLVVMMRQNGGSIQMTSPAAEDGAGRIAYLVHGGTVVPVMFFLSDGLATVRSANQDTILSVAPHMEPGAYGLCVATAEEIEKISHTSRCVFGNLPPFGSVTLDIGAARTKP